MNFRKLLLPIALSVGALFGSPPKADAQVSSYSFAQTSGTFVPVSAAGTIVANSTGTSTTYDTDGWIISLPFTFQFNGLSYTSIFANSNGGATFGTTTSTSSALISASTAYTGALAPMNRDLWAFFTAGGARTLGSTTITGVTSFLGLDVGDTLVGTGIATNATVVSFNQALGTIEMSAAATSTQAATVNVRWGAGSFRTETLGTAPNRTFVMEWNKFADYNASSVSNTAFDFQIRLVETSNIVRFVYGSYTSTSTTSRTNQVGLRGATNADYNNRMAALTAGFNNTTPGTSNSSTVARDNVTFPTPGLTFSWTPPTCLSPTVSSPTALTTTSATLNWVAPTSAPTSGYEYEVRSSGVAGSGATGLIASGTTAAGVTMANVTGLMAATTYTVYVRSNCGTANGFSNWTTGFAFTTPCATFTAPFQEGFNTGALPTCWTNSNSVNSTSANMFWKFGTGFGYGTSNNGRPAGTFAFVDASSPSSDVVTLTSPVINLSALTSPYVKFDWFKNNGSTATTFTNNNLEMEGYNGTVWISLFNDTTNNPSWRTVGVTLPASFNNISNAQFRFNVNKSLSGDFYDDVLLDSFAVQNTPSCIVPGAVTASNVTTNSATLTWGPSASAPASGYQYEVRFSGAAGSGTMGLAASGSTAAGVFTANVVGLLGTTSYTAYVRANCGPGSTSAWVATTFVTSLDCATAPVISGCGVSQTFTTPAGTGVWDLSTATPSGPFSTNGIEKLYTFTPPATGVYTLNVTAVTGSYVDYFVKPVSSGCNINGFRYIKDIVNPTTDTFTLQGGVAYYILADPEGTAGVSQTFSIICPPSCGVPTALGASSTTTTTAVLGWTPATGNTTSQWQISYGPTGTTAAAGTKVIVSTNPYTLTGLTAATAYTAYVRAICGPNDTSAWSADANFSTQCNAFTAPFQEGFNIGALPTCWTNSNSVNSTSANMFWKFGTGFGYGTSNNGRPAGTFAFVDASSPSSDVVTLTSPVINLSALTSPYVKFDWFKDASAYTYPANNLQLEGYNGTAWVSLFNDTTHSQNWRTVGITLPASFNNITNAQFRFNVNKSLSSYFYDDVLLDSFAVQNTPTCIAPSTISTTNVTATSATLNWVAPTSAPTSGYEYEVRSSGVAGSGATGLIASGTTAAGVTMANVTGLMAATTYTVYVRSNCGTANGFSNWTTGFAFTTPCATFTAPFQEGFNTGALPTCWTNSNSVNSTSANMFWKFGTGFGYGTSNNGRPAGTFAFVDASSPSSDVVTLTSPVINLSALTSPYVKFDWFKNNGSTATTFTNNNLEMEGYNGTVWISLFNDTTNNPSWRTVGVTLPASFNNISNAQFRFNVNKSLSGDFYDDVLLDSFAVQNKPVCAVPTNLTASSTSTTAVSLSWAQPAASNPAQWQVSYGTTGTTAAAGTKVVVSANPYSLSGLTANTGYTAYVRAICGANDTSAWSAGVNFTTTCPTVMVNLGNDTAICAGSNRILNAGNAGSTYLWSTSATTQTISVTAAGTYSVRVTNANGCIGRDTIVITTNPLPVVALGPDTTLCAGNSLTLNAGNAGSTYVWNTNATTQTITVSTAGNYFVQVTNANGCSDIDSILVSVSPLPVVNLGPDTAFCAGDSVTLSAGNAGAAYLWSTGATTQTITASTAGSYSVRVTNAGGCIGRDTVAVTINAAPVVALGADLAFCAGDSALLDAGNAGSTYLWSTGAMSQTIPVTAAGTYSVQVTNATGCTGSDTIDVMVNPQPTSGIISTTGGSPTFMFTAVGNMNDSLRGWSFGDGTVDTAGLPTTTTHTYTANGTYTVTFYVANACGVDSTTVSVTVSNIGIKDVSLSGEITLFPNPASGFVTLQNTSTQAMKHITVLNALGAVVSETNTGNGKQERINIEDLASGTYLIRIQLDNTTVVRRLQITK